MNAFEGPASLKEGISLFIPVFNRADLIRSVVAEALGVLSGAGSPFEVVVVDDNSDDGAREIGELLERECVAAGHPMRYLRYVSGPSRRENLAASFTNARYEFVGFMDIDIPAGPVSFLQAVNALQSGRADLVIANRYHRDSNVQRLRLRMMMSFLYNALVRIAFGTLFRDHQCGVKVFRKSVLAPILFDMGYDDAFVRGWFWDAELLVRAQKASLVIQEIPVTWIEESRTTFQLLREIKCLRAMMRLRKTLAT